MRTLQRLKVTNFKSIREQELRLSPLNVFIGANGEGKSNLFEVFRFLKEIVAQNLSAYTQLKGGADLLLYYGRKRSPEMELDAEFGSGETTNRYLVRLVGSDDDSLFIAKEVAFYHDKKRYPPHTTGPLRQARESQV
jgi:predicted ATPase